jgi:hypothetical protein
MPGDLGLLRRGSPEEVPRANPRLAAAVEMCRQIDGSKSAAEIARSVYSSYGSVFRDERDAMSFVLDLLNRLRGTATS